MKKNNLGISLILLTITIIILLILTGISLTTTVTLINSSKETSFIKDMTKIQDAISQYYISTGSLPAKETISSKTATEVVNMLDNDDFKNELAQEILLNTDNNSIFYTIDLRKIGVEVTSLDIGDNEDDFVISLDGKMLYYTIGKKIGNKIYFSLSSKLLDTKKIVNVDVEIDEINIGDKIQLIKDVSVWTSEITINAKTNLTGTEALYYYIAGIASELRPVEYSGRKVIINNDTMSPAEKASFLSSEENKTITVQKKIGEELISEATINISNLDIENPSLSNMEILNTSSTEYNLVKVNSEDQGGSNLKQIMYVYSKKLDFTETIIDYYIGEVPIIDRVLYWGKTSENGEIKLPKNIASIVVIAVDNAGNISEALEYSIDLQHLVAQ